MNNRSVRAWRLSPETSRSPRPDGLDREADLIASANASDCSSEEEHAGASLAMTTNCDEEPEAEPEVDSCGYEGDVGESSKKFATSSWRASVMSRPGFSATNVRWVNIASHLPGADVWVNTLAQHTYPELVLLLQVDCCEPPPLPQRLTCFKRCVGVSSLPLLDGRTGRTELRRPTTRVLERKAPNPTHTSNRLGYCPK